MLLGYGAGAAGLLALLLALLLAGILIAWWGRRYIAARCGRPRPPLSWGGYLLASALAVYPVACALMLIDIAIQDNQEPAGGRSLESTQLPDARRGKAVR
ncbi:TPA: hypothetical protein ACKP2I_004508 [Serratia marcescens]